MEITATELKKNLGKYLELACKEEVVIKKNGRAIVRLLAVEENTAKEIPQGTPIRYIAGGEEDLSGEGKSVIVQEDMESFISGALRTRSGEEWLLAKNGNIPVATLSIKPLPRKRQFGFLKLPQEEIDYLNKVIMEPMFTEEELDEFDNKSLFPDKEAVEK